MDHPLLREGIAALVSTQSDMKLVAEASIPVTERTRPSEECRAHSTGESSAPAHSE